VAPSPLKPCSCRWQHSSPALLGTAADTVCLASIAVALERGNVDTHHKVVHKSDSHVPVCNPTAAARSALSNGLLQPPFVEHARAFLDYFITDEQYCMHVCRPVRTSFACVRYTWRDIATEIWNWACKADTAQFLLYLLRNKQHRLPRIQMARTQCHLCKRCCRPSA
jgi:hypothetical protein